MTAPNTAPTAGLSAPKKIFCSRDAVKSSSRVLRARRCVMLTNAPAVPPMVAAKSDPELPGLLSSLPPKCAAAHPASASQKIVATAPKLTPRKYSKRACRWILASTATRMAFHCARAPSSASLFLFSNVSLSSMTEAATMIRVRMLYSISAASERSLFALIFRRFRAFSTSRSHEGGLSAALAGWGAASWKTRWELRESSIISLV
jgi:hypothetical protein